jgi:hypothetical protein
MGKCVAQCNNKQRICLYTTFARQQSTISAMQRESVVSWSSYQVRRDKSNFLQGHLPRWIADNANSTRKFLRALFAHFNPGEVADGMAPL